ncbi:GNAT family N-acetyltransferase [[Kitasatospora] papulosa]|uniref:GNAT family N-acetyltransferase n=1 Tax=[Kitasatospora] papulosa TaxID=1464011 RepID=UPI0036769EAC
MPHASPALTEPIVARGDRPFLHAAETNTDAIPLYERLGFKTLMLVTWSGLCCQCAKTSEAPPETIRWGLCSLPLTCHYDSTMLNLATLFGS